MTERVLADQIGYYRNRAGEYDATAYGDVPAASERIARLVAQLQPRGRVLEIACGTGMWTAALAEVATTVVAMDAAPEALALARHRVGSGKVRFEVADAFSWTSSERFDVIFFCAWLSHVPAERFEPFWRGLRSLLAKGGRVLFVDEPVEVRDKERFVPGAGEVVERTLEDGRTFRIVKAFIDPSALPNRLRRLGWHCEITREGDDWIVGQARPIA